MLGQKVLLTMLSSSLSYICANAQRRGAACFAVFIQSRRWSRTHASQYSEDRVANWCRRLWGLRQSGGIIALTHRLAATTDVGVGGGQFGVLLGEVQSQAKLVEELKSVMVGEKGRLPDSVVESVWNVYDSIIPPNIPHDIGSFLTPTQEDGFYEFIGLLTELDVNLEDVKAAATKLNRDVATVEGLLTHAKSSLEQRVGVNEDQEETGKKDAAVISAELVAAKSALLRQCFAVRQAGSPVYYLWLRQTAPLERGMLRLMDFRRCLAYFASQCHRRISELHPNPSKRVLRTTTTTTSSPSSSSLDDNAYNVWVTRQRHVSSMDNALQLLFHEFFAKEWLVMEELSWYSTPPALLERVIAGEQVHPFTGGIADMKRRLQPARHRHLFAFFHPSVVEEPLIAVQVALTKGIAGSVDRILGRPSPLNPSANNDDEDNNNDDTEEGVDTAIFYSINSTQSALRGVHLGNLLIKRVVQEIEANLNTARRVAGRTPITTFSTLSPCPGYVPWLANETAKLQKGHCAAGRFAPPCIFGESSAGAEQWGFAPVREAIVGFAARHDEAHADLKNFTNAPEDNAAAMAFLLRLFQSPDMYGGKMWWEDEDFRRALEGPLLRSVAYYLYRVKRRSRIMDPVGNFHISNGATMLRLNYLANCTPAGSRESATVMVNYLYVPERVSDQVTAYEVDRTVAAGADFFDLLGKDSIVTKAF